tara:strand:- start:66 stop:200 length:135 start_codon:yes stop_codon:yes gene_type:complete
MESKLDCAVIEVNTLKLLSLSIMSTLPSKEIDFSSGLYSNEFPL